MPAYQLVIGNRNYSSWSLRAGLVMAASGADYEETVIPLDRPDSATAIRAHSPAGLVPVLKRHDGLTIWDSLAIAEHAAETFPAAGLWPDAADARAVARSVAAEVHAGFAPLRRHLPMDMRAAHAPVPLRDDVADDVERIAEVWRDCRQHFGDGGDFLFGRFTIADAFYAPVVSRFRTYGVPLDGVAARYADAVYGHPAMAAWLADAAAEPWSIDLDAPGS